MIVPDSQTLGLLLAATLVMLLFARRKRIERTRPSRATPVSPAELGRYAYMAAVSRDRATWIGLFLLGAEARQALGEQARDYLDRMTPAVRAHGLEQLVARIPGKGTYLGTEIDEGGTAHIRVKGQDGEVSTIPIGRVVQVGAAWRIEQAAG